MAMTDRAGVLYGPRWRERRPAPVPPKRRPGPIPRALITREGERALREELARLRLELAEEFPQRLREALSFGETASNDDYLQTKEEEAVVAYRVRQLESLLQTAEIVEEDARTANGRVSLGSTIQLEDVASGRTSEHVLTGAHEWLAPTDISANSPIGQALLDREAGDEVSVELPSGRSVALRIRNVR